MCTAKSTPIVKYYPDKSIRIVKHYSNKSTPIVKNYPDNTKFIAMFIALQVNVIIRWHSFIYFIFYLYVLYFNL